MSASQTMESWHQALFFDISQINDDTECPFLGCKIMFSWNMVCRVDIWLPYLLEPR